MEAGDEFGEQRPQGTSTTTGLPSWRPLPRWKMSGTVSSAGALSLLPGLGAGLTTTSGRLFTQASPGIPGTPETFDLFGGLEACLT